MSVSPSLHQHEEQGDRPDIFFAQEELSEYRSEGLEEQITRRADEKSRRQVGSPGRSLENWLEAVREVLSEEPQG